MDRNTTAAVQARELIDDERVRQDGKWGEQNHGAPIWLLIFNEELGEVSEAYLDYIFKGGRPDISHEQLSEYRKAYMTELVQASAVLLAWLECELRRGQ